jgi:multicomponent Na+:H+ antiporter subunit F
MLTLTTTAALTVLGIAAVLTFLRLLVGPTVPDRVIAIDLIGVLIVCALVVSAGATADQAYLDVAIVLALISFVGTIAYARYVERVRS